MKALLFDMILTATVTATAVFGAMLALDASAAPQVEIYHRCNTQAQMALSLL
jgi:hypothetical protein